MKNTDLAIVMGGNAAEAHPVGFGWVTEAMEHNNARLIVVTHVSTVVRLWLIPTHHCVQVLTSLSC
jgi:anaerobic selenocysteine-containing dehydrogenase